MDSLLREPDFQLVWPRSLFIREATALLNERSRSDWNDRCELLLADAFEGGWETGPAADLRDLSREAAQRTSPTDGWGLAEPHAQSPSSLTAQQRYLRQLIANASKLSEDPIPRAYWMERRLGAQSASRNRLDSTKATAREYVRIVQELDETGYFDKRFGVDCVDDQRGNHPSQILERWLHQEDLWPLNADRLAEDEDLMYSVIEFLHDQVARPRSPGHYHSFCDCGWHRSSFDVFTGREVYRWRVNKLLARGASGLRLADEGEDAGRLVYTTDEGRTDLTEAVVQRDGSTADEQVRHAITLFRSRQADRHQKRSAIMALALVLEERRNNILKDALPNKDRNELFRIANEFNIRHQDGKQKSDYDDFYLDWVFWLFLATIELTNRIAEDQGTGDAAE
ncbi:hypothetical protein [Dietzia sp. KRD202]|uniref:hypothetical protein n=1 Tax=Dietzia sp. KRD202 TaxID=2729732 RepID=UPI0019D0D93A|nr:hypothetical protein [Dietzia sp. KRD202]